MIASASKLLARSRRMRSVPVRGISLVLPTAWSSLSPRAVLALARAVSTVASTCGNHGIPHGWGFIYQRIPGESCSTPMVPVFVNAFFEPNAPSRGPCQARVPLAAARRRRAAMTAAASVRNCWPSERRRCTKPPDSTVRWTPRSGPRSRCPGVCGTALPVLTAPEDNLALHVALE